MKMSFDTALSMAWNAVKLNYGLLLGGTAIFMLVQVVTSILNAVAQSSNLTTSLFIQIGVGVFFGLAFGAGVFWFGVQIVRGRKPPISTLFAGFTKYLPVTGVGLVMYIILGVGVAVIAGVIFGVGLLVSSSMPTPDTWFTKFGIELIIFILATVVFIFIVFLRLAFATLICLDPERSEEGVWACLGASWRETGPDYWPLLGFYLFVTLLVLVSIIALCLPLFFLGIPILLTGMGAAYHLIFTPDVKIHTP